MIDDEHRGYLMELMATKLLCVQCDVQIIGMSATLSVLMLYSISVGNFADRNRTRSF